MINLTTENFLDLKYLATKVFSPISGFMIYDEYIKVVKEMLLLDKSVWTIPITLEVDNIKNYTINKNYDLYYNNFLVGKIHIRDKFIIDDEHIYEIYQSKDHKHPGIKKEKLRSFHRVAGEIEIKEELIKNSLYKNIVKHEFALINQKVQTIAGFQTRNAIHKAHEYLQRLALEICDGLFINPLIGWKKKGDFTQEAVMSSYNKMSNEFYPKNRVFLRGLETRMYYAGPREAVFHALLRRNMGCTHFIIGRDHAGVKDYYGIYQAQKLAKTLDEKYDLGIELLLFKEPYYCTKCKQIVTQNTCDHYDTFRVAISGTEIRNALQNGIIPDEKFMRKEISEVLISLGKDNIFIRE
ncbi:hypothetical protein ACD571_06015 [Campylobacter sp. LH-2024]|uniref:hypothetical protein n=1 Tax=Campylobacter sp. LH-2024 TaxID=3239825 RepID=UPI003AA7B465